MKSHTIDIKRCMSNMNETRSQIFLEIGKIQNDIDKYESGAISLEELKAKYGHLLPSRK